MVSALCVTAFLVSEPSASQHKQTKLGKDFHKGTHVEPDLVQCAIVSPELCEVRNDEGVVLLLCHKHLPGLSSTGDLYQRVARPLNQDSAATAHELRLGGGLTTTPRATLQ